MTVGYVEPTRDLMVLSFHIKGYKTERDGIQVRVMGADDVYIHHAGATSSISLTINNILVGNKLTAADVISISGDVTGMRDAGSWDFWMFCRNPYYVNPAAAMAALDTNYSR
jgi:hypothetical protein